MADEHAIARYRRWYRTLLRFYARPYRERFAESMEQTFNDLCRERSKAGKGLLRFVLWMFVETSAAIIRENITLIIMQNITRRLSVWAIVVAAVLMILLTAVQNSGAGVVSRRSNFAAHRCASLRSGEDRGDSPFLLQLCREAEECAATCKNGPMSVVRY